VTIVVDVANVMGSRPDGWWRDRAGAAIRLYDQIVRLAASGRAILPDEASPADPAGSRAEAGPRGEAGPRAEAGRPGFTLVLEGAANAAAARMSPAEPGDVPDVPGVPGVPGASGAVVAGHRGGPGVAEPPRPGEVRVVRARGSGDDAIITLVRELPGRRLVVTADRELRARVAAVGATVAGPGWLLGLLKD